MESETRKIQLRCLKILDIIDDICKRYGIAYSLCGGSVVGAHLYNRCLEWDDDVDLMMTRENYNRFIDVAPSSLPSGFTLWNYQVSDDTDKSGIKFSKVIDESTTIVQPDGNIFGIFIDITVYDKIPNGWLRHVDIILFKLATSIETGSLAKKGFKNTLRTLALKTVFRNRTAYLKLYQKVVEFIGRMTTDYSYAELFGAYYESNTNLFRPSVFENYTTIEFEGKPYMIVRDYVEYLQVRYNRTDFHEPKEKQKSTHHTYVNFHLPYKEYVKGEAN